MRVKGARVILSVLLSAVAGLAMAQTPESAFNRDPWPKSDKGPVKVFILAGQSNMQGHASLRTLEYLIYNEETAAKYQQWKDRMGNWTERRDVWIWTTDGARYGNLKPGYGANPMCFGPELGFGWIVGEHFEEQVLIIKTCWGGRSVKRDFRPPSAGLPPDDVLQEELERARKRDPNVTMEDIKARYGKAYRDMIAAVRDVLENMEEYFPGYKEKQGWELAGFVFFQGWNDMIDRAQRAEQYASYTKWLGMMIQDLRRELNAPNLPVVIGELGVGGKRWEFQFAQAAVADLPELKGTVKVVPTAPFWDFEIQKLYESGIWKSPDWPKFYNLGCQPPYHYLGAAKIMYPIGEAFGKAMIELIEGQPQQQQAAQ